ncbi:MAG: hypothetical protein LBF69_04540 [Prevotellaceae bacterium]|jgi:hypothetical protein|nr:hypothetical protein [Prevotellaceae bacterium]
MKKIFTILCIAGIVGGISCQFDLEDDPALTPTYSSFAFVESSVTVTEGQTTSFTINRGNDAYEGTLTLAIVTTGDKITAPAVEGTDFTLSKTVKFDGRYTSETVEITALTHNDKVFGDLQFGLRITQGEGSVQLPADTLWVNIEEADEAAIAFEVTEDLSIVEGGDPVTVTIVRTGADWAGTVTLEAEGGADYVELSPVAFAFGETSKVVTITPAAADGLFAGNTTFALSIKEAYGATVDERKINVTVKEADNNITAFKTFIASKTWYVDFYDEFNEGYYYYPLTFTATAVDTVYTMTIYDYPALSVWFAKNNFSLNFNLRQDPSDTYRYGSTNYYTRWATANRGSSGGFTIVTTQNVKYTIPLGQVDYGEGNIVPGYEFNPAFLLGLYAYTNSNRTQQAGWFEVFSEVVINGW